MERLAEEIASVLEEADDLIKTKDDVKEVISALESAIQDDIKNDTSISEDERALVSARLQIAFNGAVKILESKFAAAEELKPQPVPHVASVSSPDVFSQLSADYAYAFLIKNQPITLRTGVFSESKRNVDTYLAGYLPLLNNHKGWLNYTVDLQAAADIHIPTQENKWRATGSLAALFYLGAEHKVAEWLKFREGIEAVPHVWAGYHSYPDVIAPITAGGSAVFNFGRSKLAVGAKLNLQTTPNDVQNPIPYPNFDNVSPIFSFASPYINVDVEVPVYRNGGELAARVFHPFALGSGNTLETYMEFTGAMWGVPFIDPGFFFGIKYSFDKDSHRAEVNVEASLTSHLIDSRIANDPRLAHLYYVPGGLNLDVIAGEDHSAVTNKKYERVDDIRLDHYKWFDECQQIAEDAWVCQGEQSKNGYTIHRQVKVMRKGNKYITDSNVETYVDINDPVYKSLFAGKTLGDFVASLDNARPAQKIAYLYQLAKLAYATYDDIGMLSPNGSGKVNSISNGEIYAALRKQAAVGYSLPTTVCRGFSKFMSKIAADWGLEAYSVVFNTKNMPHVIPVVREKGKDSYYFIDTDNPLFSTSGSLVQALEAYTTAQGYGPQVHFRVFDSDGKYLRTLETTYGRMFKARTEPSSKLDPFIKGDVK